MKLKIIFLCLLLISCDSVEEKSNPLSNFVLQPLGKLPLFEAKDLNKGKPSVVNFWASWCLPCRAEHHLLLELSQNGVRVFGIAYRDDPKNALRFLQKLGNPFNRVGLDKTGYAALGWGLHGVPETFVLDAKGKIIFHHLGPLTDLTQIKKALKAEQQ